MYSLPERKKSLSSHKTANDMQNFFIFADINLLPVHKKLRHTILHLYADSVQMLSVLANRTLPIISDGPVTRVNASFLRIITLRLVERRIDKSIDRQSEVAYLNWLRSGSPAQSIAICGSRKVGKAQLFLQ
jgi:hypothetical protein